MNQPTQSQQNPQHLPPQQEHPPRRAALCGLLPGLGAVYNQQYQKAVIHFAVFAVFWQLADIKGVFVLAAIGFYMFTIIDAYRSAEVIAREGMRRAGGAQRGVEDVQIKNLPLWGGFLVVMGFLFLLDSLNFIYLRRIFQLWPLIFIGVGLYLIYSWISQQGPPSVSDIPQPEVTPPAAAHAPDQTDETSPAGEGTVAEAPSAGSDEAEDGQTATGTGEEERQ